MRVHTDASRMETADGATLGLKVAGEPKTLIALQPGWRTYEVLLPPQTTVFPPVQAVTLSAATIQQGTRALGIPIDKVYARPLGNPIQESLLGALLFTWRFGLILWIANLALYAFQPTDRRLHAAANLLLGLIIALTIAFWSLQSPIASGWMLNLNPTTLGVSTLVLIIVQLGVNIVRTAQRDDRPAIYGMLKRQLALVWHPVALFVIFGAILAHVYLYAPMPPMMRALAAWYVLLLPGALLARLVLPERRDPLLSAWIMACGAIMTAAVLVLALTMAPGALTWWKILTVFDGMSLITGWITLRQPPAPPRTAATNHPASALAIIMILAAVLRLGALGNPETHVDEARVMLAATAVVAGDSGALFIRDKGPVEVLLTSGPLALTGQLNEFSGRLPFALAGLATVLGAYLLARSLWRGADEQAGIAVGTLAAALLAVDGLMVGFSRTIQYQSIIALLAIGAAWTMTRLIDDDAPAPKLFIAGALCLAVGILAHYDAIYVAPALLIPLIAYARRRSFGALIRTAAPAAAGGIALLGGFFVPFVLYPRFTEYTLRYLSGRVGATRSGLGLVNNLGLYEPLITFYSATVVVYAVVALLIAGGVIWLLRYARWRWLGAIGATIFLFGCAIQAIRPEAFMLPDGTNAAAFAFAPPLLLMFTRRTPASLRLLLSWFSVIFVAHSFLIAIPNTHFFTMHIPAALLAGWAMVDIGRFAAAPLRRWLTAGALAVSTALLAYAAIYANIAFVRQTPEYVRTYPAARPPFYPASYGDQLPQDQGFYGFPRQDGWKAIGQLYDRGTLQGTYGSNQKPEVTGWYMQGQPRCETRPTYYFLTYRESYVLPEGYHLFGYIRVGGERVMAIYRNSYVDYQPRDYDVEPRINAADARMIGAPPISGAMGEYLPQYTLGDAMPFLGYDLDMERLVAGKTTNLALYWDAAHGSDEAPLVELMDSAGQPVGSIQMTCPAEPAERWRDTTLRVAWWSITPGRALPAGMYTLQARIGEKVIKLRTIQVGA